MCILTIPYVWPSTSGTWAFFIVYTPKDTQVNAQKRRVRKTRQNRSKNPEEPPYILFYPKNRSLTPQIAQFGALYRSHNPIFIPSTGTRGGERRLWPREPTVPSSRLSGPRLTCVCSEAHLRPETPRPRPSRSCCNALTCVRTPRHNTQRPLLCVWAVIPVPVESQLWASKRAVYLFYIWDRNILEIRTMGDVLGHPIEPVGV
jgi:hypothetical protein